MIYENSSVLSEIMRRMLLIIIVGTVEWGELLHSEEHWIFFAFMTTGEGPESTVVYCKRTGGYTCSNSIRRRVFLCSEWCESGVICLVWGHVFGVRTGVRFLLVVMVLERTLDNSCGDSFVTGGESYSWCCY